MACRLRHELLQEVWDLWLYLTSDLWAPAAAVVEARKCEGPPSSPLSRDPDVGVKVEGGGAAAAAAGAEVPGLALLMPPSMLAAGKGAGISEVTWAESWEWEEVAGRGCEKKNRGPGALRLRGSRGNLRLRGLEAWDLGEPVLGVSVCPGAVSATFLHWV